MEEDREEEVLEEEREEEKEERRQGYRGGLFTIEELLRFVNLPPDVSRSACYCMLDYLLQFWPHRGFGPAGFQSVFLCLDSFRLFFIMPFFCIIFYCSLSNCIVFSYCSLL